MLALIVSFPLGLAAGGAAARHHRAPSDGQAGVFDYYVLSLSWAPTYCLTHQDGSECSGKGYGFVLHGLWPQYDAGGYPENCPSLFDLTAAAAAKGRSIYPSEHLMTHEWQEHGRCTGFDALGYFRAADRATAAVKIPEALESPQAEKSLTAPQIAGLFRSANPQMPADAMTVACARGSLSEVRICLAKDLAPRSCGRGVRTTCPSYPVRVPASR